MDYLGYIKKEKKGFVIFLFFLSLLQLLPFFLLKENVTIPVNDTMDAYIPQYKTTATKEFAFCSFDKQVPQLMNGLNRDLLVSDLSIIYILFLFFNTFWAYTINVLLIKVIAFFGMYLLLKNNFSTFSKLQITIGAFLFSCIPFFPFFGIGIAGQPLLINTLINFHKKRSTYTDCIVLILFPFYSSLIFTNIFIIFSSFLVCAFLLYQNRKIPYRLFIATALILILGILVEYRLIHVMSNGFIAHRLEFDLSAFITQQGVAGLFNNTFKILSSGLIHVETYYFIFLFALLFICILKIRNSNYKKTIFIISIYILFIGLLYGYSHSTFYKSLTDKIGFLKTFQIDRFYTLLPFLYFLLGAFCIQSILEDSNMLKKNIVKFIIAASVVVLFFNNLPMRAVIQHDKKNPTYSEYYDVSLFEEVKKSIPLNPSDYHLVCVGVTPEVLQYNGFQTLDAYLNLYPLAYKHQFRKVIENELAKSEELKKYFDCWGNRCYVFSAELGYRFDSKGTKKKSSINDLNINITALKEINSKELYLVSAETIKNSSELGLSLVKEFNSYRSYRNILLYKVL